MAKQTLVEPEVWRSLAVVQPPRPVVADANALFQDALRRTRDGFTALTFLAEQGSIVIFTPTHVASKARQHLPRMAEGSKIDEGLVMGVWQRVYEPLVRFVDVPPCLCSTDPRVEGVRDPEDVPFAQLAVAVAPCLFLTRDHHLRDARIGTESWVDALLILGGLIELELVFYGGTRFAMALGYLVARMLGEGARLLSRSPVAIGVTIAACVLVLTTVGRDHDLGIGKAGRTLRKGGENLLDAVGPLLEQQAEAHATLATMLVAPMEPTPPEAICARQLAVSRGALGCADLLPALRLAGYGYVQADLERNLAAHPSFVSSTRGWLLGQAA